MIFVKAELGLSFVVLCNLSCNSSRNFVEGGVTSALRETLRRLTHRATDTSLEEQFTSAVSESWNLVLLFVAVEASCFAWIFRFTVCYSTCCFTRLVTPFSRRLRDKLRDRLHCTAGLSHEHKCLPGWLWWIAGKKQQHKNCLFVSLFAFDFVLKKIKLKKSSRSCPCLSGCFHSALCQSVSSGPL